MNAKKSPTKSLDEALNLVEQMISEYKLKSYLDKEGIE